MTPADLPRTTDVVVVGAGHNGLVAAALLAAAGRRVTVLEAADVVGGACRTEHPFARAPRLAASTGAYLLGPFPPELLRRLDIRLGQDLHLVRRDPHYFLPTLDGRHLLLGGDAEDNTRQFAAFFTEADAKASAAYTGEIAAIAHDLAPAWLAPPLSVEDTAERHLRPSLRRTFVDLVRGSAVDHLQRFGFLTEDVVAMYAVTDGMPGLSGSPWTPGSGHNLLVHNMCRLPGADGTWMVVRGGMGAVTTAIAGKAVASGATVHLGVPVAGVDVRDGSACGVTTADGRSVAAEAVVLACDPFRIPGLLGVHTPAVLSERVDAWAERSPGQTMKVNLALDGLPRFAALPEPRGQHGTTVHLLPEPVDGSVLTALRRVFDGAAAGSLEHTPPLEWYLHSTLDPGLADEDGHHSSALFVQGVPHTPAGSTWDAERSAYVEKVLDLAERYVPDLRARTVEVQALAPPDLERHFGITHGNIHHVDPTFSFLDRMPYDVGVPGVWAASAGCFPSGSVIGAAGHNVADLVLAAGP